MKSRSHTHEAEFNGYHKDRIGQSVVPQGHPVGVHEGHQVEYGPPAKLLDLRALPQEPKKEAFGHPGPGHLSRVLAGRSPHHTLLGIGYGGVGHLHQMNRATLESVGGGGIEPEQSWFGLSTRDFKGALIDSIVMRIDALEFEDPNDLGGTTFYYEFSVFVHGQPPTVPVESATWGRVKALYED